MPMVLAAVGSAVAWVSATAAAVGTATSMALTFAGLSAGQIAALGTVASWTGLLAVSAAATALMTPSVGRGGSPIQFKADPSAPISGVMGRFGVGGRQVHANVWGKDNLYLSFAVALSLGPIQSYESFTAAGTAVTFPGAQGLAAATEPYINKMWQTTRLGLPTDAYLSPPTGVSDGTPAMSEWTSAHTLPGFAHVFWTMKNNSKREGYQGGVPAPLWTLLGMKVWDPRLDSTYPGGSGSQRRTDWTTWAYSANPYLHALAWVRGHHKLVSGGTIDTTKRLAGVGAPDASIDIAAFVEGANVADSNSWAIAGEWTTADDKWQTLAAMLQAGGGVPISQGAQISCMVETPRTSLMTVTGADIVGSVSINVMASRRDRPNTVIPRVRLEAHKFEEVALGAVTSATYVTEDAEEKRVIETAYRFVGLAKQGAELAGYGLANTRETLKGSIPCKPYLLGLRAGDAFTVTEPELGLNGQKFVVLRRSFDPASAVVTLDVRSETDAKHAWALGRSADAPASPSLTAPDPVPATPVDGDWTVVARPVEASGVQQPGLIITGAAVGENIGTVLIEYSTSSSGPWTQAYSGPPTIASVEINGLVGGTDYYVGITYWSLRAVPSEKLVKGPYTAPGLTAGDVLQNSPAMLEVFYQQVDAVLASTLRIIDEQERRVTATTDTQRFIDRIGRVDPATGEVDLRDTAARFLIGRTTMHDAVERVDEGLDGGGFIRRTIPRSVALDSNAHNEQITISDDGVLLRDGLSAGGTVLRVAEATQNLGHDSVVRRGTAPQGGRMFLQKPLSGTTLTGDLAIDVYSSELRIFDATTISGISLPFTQFAASIGARFVTSDSAGVVAGDITSATALKAPYARIGNAAGIGFITLDQGDAANTGYLGFFNAAGTRYGYIGFVNTTAKIIDFRAENGATFQFTGGVANFSVRPTFNGSVPWDALNFDPSLKLNASAYTAADVLAKMLTVDGAASGLDADLLDGQSGAFYQDAANLTGSIAAARMPALTGDVTTVVGAIATTLATVNSNVGTFGSATLTPIVTVSAKGLVTAVATATITPAFGSITGTPTTLSGYGITDAVALAGAQTVAGVKTFSNTPVAPGLTTVAADMALSVDTGQGFRLKVAAADVFLFEADGRLSLNAVSIGGFGLGEWADWTPTPSTEGGAATGLAMVYAERTRHGKTVTVSFAVSQTAINTATGAIIVPLPWAAKAARNYFGSGKNFNNGNVLLIDANGANLRITAANAYPMGAGAESFSGTITYQAA